MGENKYGHILTSNTSLKHIFKYFILNNGLYLIDQSKILKKIMSLPKIRWKSRGRADTKKKDTNAIIGYSGRSDTF